MFKTVPRPGAHRAARATVPRASRAAKALCPAELTLAWWTPGPASGSGTVLVSVTDFRLRRFRDMLRVFVAGLRLRRAWPSMTGAVGLWLWGKPLFRQAGSVSVWRDEEDLRRFVAWHRHRELMRRYGDAGTVTSRSWREERFDPRRALSQAAVGCAAHDAPPPSGASKP